MNIAFEPLSELHFSLLLKWLKSPHVKQWWDQDVSYTIDLVRKKYGSYAKGYKLIKDIPPIFQELDSKIRSEERNVDNYLSTGAFEILENQFLKDRRYIRKPIQAFIILIEKNPIGYIQIYSLDDFVGSERLLGLPENIGAFDIFIGEEVYLKQNLGSKAILKFLKLHSMQYSHMFADPDSSNLAAIKCYEKAGFKKIEKQKNLGLGKVWMLLEN